jgi:iron transport multicopper oxidase
MVDSIQIFAGQRYSFILTADKPVNNYWVRAQPNSGNTASTGGINSAILRYEGASVVEPITRQCIAMKPLIETNLHPLECPAAPGIPEPGAADVNLVFNMNFDTSTLKFTINNATFIPPSVPVLLQIISGASTPQDLLPSRDVYTLPPNKVIEISMPGNVAGGPVSNKCVLIIYLNLLTTFSQHPIHLHGVRVIHEIPVIHQLTSLNSASCLCYSKCK